MNRLYPLKFRPICKDKIWGGQRIKNELGIDTGDLPNCGEVWLLSAVPGENSVVANGFLAGNELGELVEVYMEDLLGDTVFEKYQSEFPLLVKILDTNAWLSIQVHPDDKLAMRRHHSLGKTEMWYIMDAEPDAELIAGFSKPLTKDTFKKLVEHKSLKDALAFEKVKAGDCFFIPAGRVHALGPGITLAEIQQTSDITYRIDDWDRIDHTGMRRELHTELAVDAIDFEVRDDYRNAYHEKENGTANLVICSQFHTSIVSTKQPLKKDYSELDSFVIHLCIDGAYHLGYDEGNISMKKGECVLIPNELKTLLISPKPMARILEIYIV